MKGIPPPQTYPIPAPVDNSKHIFHRRKLNSLSALSATVTRRKGHIQSCSCDYRLKSLAAIGEKYGARDCAHYSTLLAVGQAFSF